MNNQERQALIMALKILEPEIKAIEIPALSKAIEISLAALNAEPITLPRVSHPAQFDYADKVEEVLKTKGLSVTGYDDES